MSDKFFLDTNVFVYCFDTSSPDKLKISNDLVHRSIESGLGVISFQVIQEFLNVALQKFAVPLTLEDSQVYIDNVFFPLCRVLPDVALYKEACDIKKKAGFSFCDCLVLAAAMRQDCGVLYSEDFQHGFQLHKLTIVNHFIEKV